MRRVIKFGGTSLATPELVREGARHVARLVEYGEQIAVVVSAPGNATSELLTAIYAVSDQHVDFPRTCEFAALGEEQSVHMMVAALRSFGVNAQPFIPRQTESWPIIADLEDNSPLATAKINEERPFNLRTQQTVSRFRRFVLPHLRVGTVPVISGFFAVDSAEHVVALGRGGSDITAFITATQISADEVAIVTDVQGVLSADPRLAENPRLLTELTIEDLEAISAAGARVLHPRALNFMTPALKVRLLDYRELEQLEESGTSVLGMSRAALFRNPAELSMLSLVGDLAAWNGLSALLAEWLGALDGEPAGVSITPRFACIYLPSATVEPAYAELHKQLGEGPAKLKNLSLKGGIGELRLSSGRFIDEPGVLSEITGVLANAKINIIEIITSLSDISVFVAQDDMDKAEQLLGRVLERLAG
ncbi:ACT domain-containing protein [bacterium]|nr:ACT domain-containing protein [bacterium]